MSAGMNVNNGKFLLSGQHLRQSIAQILTTPIGSRVMRRNFGSLLPDLLDHPLNPQTILQLYAATATALLLYEPRLRLTKVDLNIGSEHGQASLVISGVTKLGGFNESIDIDIPIKNITG